MDRVKQCGTLAPALGETCCLPGQRDSIGEVVGAQATLGIPANHAVPGTRGLWCGVMVVAMHGGAGLLGIRAHFQPRFGFLLHHR